jgi:preprotein translocase subunit SecD
MMIPVRNPIGRTYTEHIRAQTFARLTALLAVASIVAGCSAANGDGGSPTPPLQMRLVTSSAEGPCSAPPLTSDGPGSACDRAGTTTYELGESLGVVTPTSATLDGQGSGQTVVVGFDKADASKLGDVTREALEKQLAILLDGKVLSAPVVKDPITTGKVAFAFGTASEAGQVAAELGASATS